MILYNNYERYFCDYCLDKMRSTMNYPYQYYTNSGVYGYNYYEQSSWFKDYGPCPYVLDIEKATKNNKNFRTTLWTGDHLQLTLMSIEVGQDIGLEIHPDHDQFIRIEDGCGIIKMGARKNDLNFQRKVEDDFAIIIPAGTWHNLINTGSKPLKLYSIYAPPEHPPGTIDRTKKDSKH